MSQVFIIEDDPSIAFMLDEVLQLNGIDTCVFECAHICLANLPEVPPSLIISDMILPKMSARELLEKIRCHYRSPDIQAIFMSARTKDEVQECELNASAVEFISKPFNIQSFVSRVLEIVGPPSSATKNH
jgi:two-component system response regulator ResD